MRVGSLIGACAIVLGQVCLADAAAQSAADLDAIKKAIESLTASQVQLQGQLNDIKAMLQKSPANAAPTSGPTPGTQISLAGAPIRGAAEASVALIEYSDFQCPFCASYAANSYPKIIEEYVDTGKIRYAFMSFPLEGLHPLAWREHIAASCAADEGRFWEMHDRLLANPKAADTEALLRHAAALGLEHDTFRRCVESERHAGEIRRAMATGTALGISGTPTFVIGTIGPEGNVKVAKVISGAKPYAAFKDSIEGVLASAPPRDSGTVAAEPKPVLSGWSPMPQRTR
jgi:protein-disulfide isomerase